MYYCSELCILLIGIDNYTYIVVMSDRYSIRVDHNDMYRWCKVATGFELRMRDVWNLGTDD